MSSFSSCSVISRPISGFTIKITGDKEKMRITTRYINYYFLQIKQK